MRQKFLKIELPNNLTNKPNIFIFEHINTLHKKKKNNNNNTKTIHF